MHVFRSGVFCSHVTRLFLLAAALFAAASPSAQALGPHGDVAVGYSRLWDPGDGLNGWQVDGHLKVVPFLGVEGGYSNYAIAGGHDNLFLIGPRATLPIHRTHLFAHFLLGGQTAEGLGGFLYAVGGGVDLPVVSHLAWRVAADRLVEPGSSSGAGRFNTGPVLRF